MTQRKNISFTILNSSPKTCSKNLEDHVCKRHISSLFRPKDWNIGYNRKFSSMNCTAVWYSSKLPFEWMTTLRMYSKEVVKSKENQRSIVKHSPFNAHESNKNVSVPPHSAANNPDQLSRKQAHHKLVDEILHLNESINPIYTSWTKSPAIRKKELMQRRQRAREAYADVDPETLEKQLLAKYFKLYQASQMSLCQLIFHKPIPNHIAVASFDAQIKKRNALSYSQLNQYSNSVAHFLRRKGLKKGDAVGVMLHDDHNLVIALMACLRAGFVFVPLDPFQLKPYQIEERIQNADCKWIISHIDFHDTIQILPCRNAGINESNFGNNNNGKIVNLLNWTEFGVETPMDVKDFAKDDEYYLYEHVEKLFDIPYYNRLTQIGNNLLPNTECNETVSPKDTMCILYTVNSSGEQTGVKVPYEALASIHSYMEIGLNLEEEERMWITLPAYSTFGILYGLIGKLLLGAEIVLPFGSLQGSFYMAAIRALEIDSLVVSDFFLESLVKDARSQQSDFLKVSLSKVVFTGSRMNPTMIEPFEHVWSVIFKNHYATSEDGVLVYNALHPKFSNSDTSFASGKVASGYKIALLRNNYELIENTGEAGEIAVEVDESPLYWFKSFMKKDNCKKFIQINGKTFALTGDLGKYNEDMSSIEITGRSEFVVMNMGEKVDVNRVESIICQHPGIEDALIISVPGRRSSYLLCVAIRKETGISISKEDLEMEAQLIQEWCQESSTLVPFEIPKKIVFIEHFPFADDRQRMRVLLREGFSKGIYENRETIQEEL